MALAKYVRCGQADVPRPCHGMTDMGNAKRSHYGSGWWGILMRSRLNFLGDGEKWLNIICADPVSRWTCIVMERYATWLLFHSCISAVASDLFQESEHLGSINLTPRDFLDGWLIRHWGRSLFFCFFQSNQQKSRQSISCLKPCFTGNRPQCLYRALYLFPANVLHCICFFLLSFYLSFCQFVVYKNWTALHFVSIWLFMSSLFTDVLATSIFWTAVGCLSS